jgi:6-phospho-beta-glucosidase
MIVTILGGSAFSTPSLINWLASQELSRSAGTGRRFLSPALQQVPDITFRLAGRTSEHLAAVARASRLLAKRTPIVIEQFERYAWDEALQDADIVLIQVRVGGFAAREFDETFPLSYGIPGDEGLGPGGLSAALRNWPVVRDILYRVRRHAPRSLPILLTSPGSLLARLAALHFADFPVYSICELPFTTLDEICRASFKETCQVDFSYAGVNHLGWLYRVSYRGDDLIETYREQHRQSWFYPLMREYGAVPLKYFQLHLHSQRVTASQSRARQLATVQQHAFSIFHTGDAKEIRQALHVRRTPWYTEAVGPLLLQLDRPFFLSTSDFEGNVSERAYSFQNGKFHPLPNMDPPEEIRQLNTRYIHYEEQAAFSLQEPDEKKLAVALTIHPWISRKSDALGLAGTLWSHFQSFVTEQKQSLWLN